VLKRASEFVEVRIGDRSPWLADAGRFQPVRVVCQWSKTLSFVGVTVACMHGTMRTNTALRHKLLAQLTKKWVREGIHTIEPPFDPNLAKHFSEKVMKMPTASKSDLNKAKQNY
jgi:hypothetical protein